MSTLTTSRIRTVNGRLQRGTGSTGAAVLRGARHQGAHPAAHLAGHLRLAAAPGRAHAGVRDRPRAGRTGAVRHGRRADHGRSERDPLAGPGRRAPPRPAPGPAQGADVGAGAAARRESREHAVGVPAVQCRRQDGGLAHRGPPAPGRPAAADPPARLSLTAVRGYQGQADRIAQCLAAQPGVFPGAPPPLDAVLATVGHAPGEYTNKVDVELSATMPARMALAAVLLRLLDTLEANVAGTIRDIDTEFLHDLRVAVRRTRTALKLGGRPAAGRPGRRVPARLQVAGRPHDAHPRPRRAPADLRRRSGRADLRQPGRPGAVPRLPRRAAHRRAAPAGPRAALGALHHAQRRVARHRSPASRPRGGARTRHMPPRGSSAARTGASWSVAARSVPALPRSSSTTCASGARNCGTPWNSSLPCTTCPRTGGRCES